MQRATHNARRVWNVVPLVPLSARGRQVFSYLAPEPRGAERGEVAPGALVRIPFGPRTVRGIVWNPVRRRPAYPLKTITAVLSRQPLFLTDELEMFQELAALSLEPLASLMAAATRVREPIRDSAVQRVNKTHQRGTFRVSVHWSNLAAALPMRVTGQVLVLVPETVLARSALEILEQRGVPSALFAQGLRSKERRRVVERLVSGKPLAVIATHPGIFLPLATLSQIFVVEAALPSHRQWDLHPRYDARVGALLLGRQHSVSLALQSSLPSLDLIRLGQKNGEPKREQNFSFPCSVLPRGFMDPLISPTLLIELQTALGKGKTAFLFHDIVGTERAFACETCGVLLRCGACGGMLERAGASLRCRVCGADGGHVPNFCPRCKSPHLTARRIGTAHLEIELRRALPDTLIVRADRETLPRTKASETPTLPRGSIVLGTERAFAAIAPGSVDCVMVIDADRVLEETRFDAAERWVTLLTRLASLRKPGSTEPLTLQTAHPNLPVVRALAEGNLTTWIEQELSDRQQLHYSPFVAQLTLEKNFRSHALATSSASKARARLQGKHKSLSTGFRSTGLSHRPRGEIVLRGPLPALKRALKDLPAGWSTDALVPLSLL